MQLHGAADISRDVQPTFLCEMFAHFHVLRLVDVCVRPASLRPSLFILLALTQSSAQFAVCRIVCARAGQRSKHRYRVRRGLRVCSRHSLGFRSCTVRCADTVSCLQLPVAEGLGSCQHSDEEVCACVVVDSDSSFLLLCRWRRLFLLPLVRTERG